MTGLPRLMDCKEWGNNRDKAWVEHLQELEAALSKHEAPGGHTECIEPLRRNVGNMKKMMEQTWCKDDCTFCEVHYYQSDNGGHHESRSCMGPNDPRYIRNYPLNGCQRYSENDKILPEWGDLEMANPYRGYPSYCLSSSQLRLRTSFQQNQEEVIVGEIFTCSTDGCEPPVDTGEPCPLNPIIESHTYSNLPNPNLNPTNSNSTNPNPTNPNPNSLNPKSANPNTPNASPNPANPNSTNPNPPNSNPKTNSPNANPNPSNTNDNTGTTANNYSDPAAHPNIFYVLFIFTLFFVI